MKKNYYSNYLKTLINNINQFDLNNSEEVEKKIKSLKKNNKIIFFGNGGSAAICNHFAIDFSKRQSGWVNEFIPTYRKEGYSHRDVANWLEPADVAIKKLLQMV